MLHRSFDQFAVPHLNHHWVLLCKPSDHRIVISCTIVHQTSFRVFPLASETKRADKRVRIRNLWCGITIYPFCPKSKIVYSLLHLPVLPKHQLRRTKVIVDVIMHPILIFCCDACRGVAWIQINMIDPIPLLV